MCKVPFDNCQGMILNMFEVSLNRNIDNCSKSISTTDILKPCMPLKNSKHYVSLGLHVIEESTNAVASIFMIGKQWYKMVGLQRGLCSFHLSGWYQNLMFTVDALDKWKVFCYYTVGHWASCTRPLSTMNEKITPVNNKTDFFSKTDFYGVKLYFFICLNSQDTQNASKLDSLCALNAVHTVQHIQGLSRTIIA